MPSHSTPFQKQTHFPRYSHLISKRLDPIFALAIGLSAAIIRIRREEEEKGQTAEQTWESFKRRSVLTWNQPWSWNTLVGRRQIQSPELVQEDGKGGG